MAVFQSPTEKNRERQYNPFKDLILILVALAGSTVLAPIIAPSVAPAVAVVSVILFVLVLWANADLFNRLFNSR